MRLKADFRARRKSSATVRGCGEVFCGIAPENRAFTGRESLAFSDGLGNLLK